MNDPYKFHPSPVVVWNLATEMLENFARTEAFLDRDPERIARHVIAVAEAMQAQFVARYPDAIGSDDGDDDAQQEAPIVYPRSH